MQTHKYYCFIRFYILVVCLAEQEAMPLNVLSFTLFFFNISFCLWFFFFVDWRDGTIGDCSHRGRRKSDEKYVVQSQQNCKGNFKQILLHFFWHVW